MTKQEKQLLLIDLCARLPYFELIVQYKGEDFNIIDIGFERVTLVKPFMSITSGSPLIKEIKPYLRPMSSMTNEERKHLQTLHDIISDENYGDGFSPAAWEAILDFNNYCREHHLDNGGLITLGLAIEATEGMYK